MITNSIKTIYLLQTPLFCTLQHMAPALILLGPYVSLSLFLYISFYVRELLLFAYWGLSFWMQELEFSWKLVLATVIGFLGSACGTVGGVGGGGIFVPMLTLIVGFDTKSAAALSKCKISHSFFLLLF
jgi:hypothetical protein